MKKILLIKDNDNSNCEKEIDLFLNNNYNLYDIIIENYNKVFSKKEDYKDFKIVINSSMSEKKRETLLINLNAKKDNVFILDINKLNILHEQNKKIDVNTIIIPYNDYYWIDKIQIPLALHCNLKCNRCYHFSNLQLNQEFYEFDTFKKDINSLCSFDFKIYEFRFLGGEPLLCNNILDYIEYAKIKFPYSKMKIVTNGILLLKKTEKFLKRISENKIIISISLYPPMEKNLFKLEELLNQYNIVYEIFRFGKDFNKILTREKNNNSITIAKQCEKCILVYNGYVSRCAPSTFINIFNQRFNYKYPEDNNKLITDFSSRKELLKYINKPVKLCEYCTGDTDPVSFKWECTSKDVGPNDYIR